MRGRRHAHGEGSAVGFVAGLVPCPLTLFVMFFALARRIPEAGLDIRCGNDVGVLSTLACVALLSMLARDWAVHILARHGASIEKLARILDGTSGALLTVIAALALME